jgi:hypothetical protein
VGGPERRADQVQGRPAVLAVERAPRGLAVDGDHALDLGGECAEVAREAGLERGGIEQPEDPRKGIVARHAARQAQEAAQQRLLAAAEQSHVDAAFGAAQRRHQRDHHDLIELMALRIAAARIGKLGETRPKTIHAVLPCNGTARSEASFYTKRIYKFLVRFPWGGPKLQSGRPEVHHEGPAQIMARQPFMAGPTMSVREAPSPPGAQD